MLDVVKIPFAESSDLEKHISNLLLNRGTPKACTGLWIDVSISHTKRVITTSGLAGHHVVSGVGQYRLKLVYVTFLLANSGIA